MVISEQHGITYVVHAGVRYELRGETGGGLLVRLVDSTHVEHTHSMTIEASASNTIHVRPKMRDRE